MIGTDAILLVDDDPADVELTLLAFNENDLGGSVRVARSAEEADELLFGNAGCRPNLVLLDLRLAGEEGVGILHRMKNDWRTATIPVVVLASSSADPERLEAAMRVGATNHVQKPVDFDKFCAAAGAFSLYWRSRR